MCPFFVVGGWVGRWGGGVVGWWGGGRVMFPSRVHVGDDLGHPKFLMVLMTQYSILCYALKHFYKYIYKHTIFSCFWDINLRSIKNIKSELR